MGVARSELHPPKTRLKSNILAIKLGYSTMKTKNTAGGSHKSITLYLPKEKWWAANLALHACLLVTQPHRQSAPVRGIENRTQEPD